MDPSGFGKYRKEKLMKERLKNVAELFTSKRVLVGAGLMIALSFISNALAMICATVTVNVYIICKTIEQKGK